MHFDMIEQRRAISCQTPAIEDAPLDRYRSRCSLGVQQQKECEKQWNVMCDGSKRFSNDVLARIRIPCGFLIVLQPPVVEPESNPLEQITHAGIVGLRQAGTFASQHPAAVRGRLESVI